MNAPHILPPPPPPPPPSSSPPRRRLTPHPPSPGRPIRWGIAAGAAVILFAILFVSFNVFGQTHPCDTTTVVSDQTNTGLIADCKVLWGLKDTLRGTATLNWNASTAISIWSGINLSGTPQRVSTFLLSGQALNGTLPPEFGNLTNLSQLTLANNSLTGPIPKELRNLTNLSQLDLSNNSLTGSIPPEFGNLPNLSLLTISNNRLTGPIPSELGDISTLLTLHLANNRLSGEFPLWVENLSGLRHFSIQGNLLTGHLPLEYPFPASISRVINVPGFTFVGSATIGGGNMFIGCLPSWATATSAVRGEENLGLPNCGSPPGESVWVLDTVLAPPITP